MTDDLRDLWGGTIHNYTRTQALTDGVLVDGAETAREADFVVPVALSADVWADVRDISVSEQGLHDPNGCLWDLLYLGRLADGEARHPRSLRDPLPFPCGPREVSARISTTPNPTLAPARPASPS